MKKLCPCNLVAVDIVVLQGERVTHRDEVRDEVSEKASCVLGV